MSDAKVAVLPADNAFTGAPTEATEVEAVRVDALAVDLALVITAHLVEAETQNTASLQLSVVPSTKASPEDSDKDDDDDDDFFVPKGPNQGPDAGISKRVDPLVKKPADTTSSTSGTTAAQEGENNDAPTDNKNKKKKKKKNQSGNTRAGKKDVAPLRK
ncbi:hypothetical protein OH76DRAFT_1396169 [Lentinus brumalis]|uniref:Uncharacterized protein n=1 Tax=Lentinus brumalis TaxID=2498619 RepID=A0A371DTJ6_9APHY|nr:hypothetical protein OH76DRAFT_1396169 [Polyporus brumalis]